MLRIVFALLLAAAVAVPATAWADYPERAVTVVVGFGPGGTVDLVTRALIEGMKRKFPKGIAVVNRSGGGGTIGASEAILARPEGYTLGMVPVANLVVHPQIGELPYRTPDDYTPVMTVASFYSVFAVRHDAPWRTAQEFVAAAKASPGKLRVGSPGERTSMHLNLEDLMQAAGIQVTHVPFAGWAELGPAILGGHVEAVVTTPADLKPQVEARRMRVLAVFRPERNPAFPDAPAWKELGWPVHYGSFFVLLAPKGAPPGAVRYIHDAAKAALEEPAFAAFARDRVMELDYRSGERTRADLWDEYRRLTGILRRLGMVPK